MEPLSTENQTTTIDPKKQEELDSLENNINSVSTGSSAGIIVEPVNIDEILTSLGISEVKMNESVDVIIETDLEENSQDSEQVPVEIFSIFPEDQTV